MINISPNTNIKVTIVQFLAIIGSLIGFGFVGGQTYTKLTYYETKMDSIEKRLGRIEKLIQNKQYYGSNEP